MNTEKIILESLVYNEEYSRKVLPFLKEEYFTTPTTKTIFTKIHDHVQKYNKIPTRKTLYVDLDNDTRVEENLFKECSEYLTSLKKADDKTVDWIMDQTESFCKDRALYNGIMKSIEIIDGKSKELEAGSIPQLLQDALAVTFETDIGHDFLVDAQARFVYYHTQEERLPFRLESFNKATAGGVPNKTLNVILAGTNVGKTLIMCDWAASHLLDGKNVLYITMEDGELKIAQRIDANLMDIPIEQIEELSEDMYLSRIQKLQKKTLGRLKIKEYPGASLSTAHIRHLLNEYKIKQNFVPDVIYVDYINCMVSERMKYGTNVNTYTYIKAIAEELRGLGVVQKCRIFTATQTNRTGFSSSDPSLEDTAESFGLPMTADWMVAVSQQGQLEELGQYLVTQLKSRYADKNKVKSFIVGVDKSKQKLYEVEQSYRPGGEKQAETPVMDNTPFGKKESKKFNKAKFQELVGKGDLDE